MIVIGTDTHKRTHALSAVDEGTGKIRGHRQIDADEPGHLAAVKRARGLDASQPIGHLSFPLSGRSRKYDHVLDVRLRA
jgi:hypothetical protein